MLRRSKVVGREHGSQPSRQQDHITMAMRDDPRAMQIGNLLERVAVVHQKHILNSIGQVVFEDHGVGIG
jgi:hypothetical protein